MVGKKLTVLTCLSISSLAAEIVTVNLSGVTVGGNYTVTQNSYSGLYSGLPGDYFSTGATTTVFAAGTPWTAQFTFDTALMPSAIQSNVSGLNGADPITTHLLDSPTVQFAKAIFSIGSFNFSTAASPLDVPPTVVPPDQTEGIGSPLSYSSRLAYGATNFAAEGFHGYSGLQSSYSLTDLSSTPGNPSTVDYSRFGALSFHIYQNDIVGPLFQGAGIPTNFSFVDSDVPFQGSQYGFGFAGFTSSADHFSTVNGALNLSANYILASGADLAVASAVTSGYHPVDIDPSPASVPEPSTLILGGVGLALIALGRRGR